MATKTHIKSATRRYGIGKPTLHVRRAGLGLAAIRGRAGVAASLLTHSSAGLAFDRAEPVKGDPSLRARA